MQRKLIALLIASTAVVAAPEAPAQRAAHGPYATRNQVSVTQFNYRHDRDFDRYRRARRVQVPRRVWVPGHYESRQRRVVIRGGTDRRYAPARFETRFDSHGRRFSVQISAGHWEQIRHPNRIEIRHERVWVPAHWKHS